MWSSTPVSWWVWAHWGSDMWNLLQQYQEQLTGRCFLVWWAAGGPDVGALDLRVPFGIAPGILGPFQWGCQPSPNKGLLKSQGHPGGREYFRQWFQFFSPNACPNCVFRLSQGGYKEACSYRILLVQTTPGGPEGRWWRAFATSCASFGKKIRFQPHTGPTPQRQFHRQFCNLKNK